MKHLFVCAVIFALLAAASKADPITLGQYGDWELGLSSTQDHTICFLQKSDEQARSGINIAQIQGAKFIMVVVGKQNWNAPENPTYVNLAFDGGSQTGIPIDSSTVSVAGFRTVAFQIQNTNVDLERRLIFAKSMAVSFAGVRQVSWQEPLDGILMASQGLYQCEVNNFKQPH